MTMLSSSFQNNATTDNPCCPICLGKLPLLQSHRFVLQCCGHSCCKACLKQNGNYVVDWCPLCRSFLKHYKEGNFTKKYAQAKRLVQANSMTATRQDSVKQGITLLCELLLQEQNQDKKEHTKMTLQLTLAKAFYKQQTQESLTEAKMILQSMIQSQQDINENQTFWGFLLSKEQHSQFHQRKRRQKLSQAHFLLAQVLEAMKDTENTTTPQHHYDRAVKLDPTNLTLLIACAKRTSNGAKAIHYHKQVLQHNKYHVDCNLYMAQHYQHYLRQHSNNHNHDTTTTNAILTSYLACVVRAEYQLGMSNGNTNHNNVIATLTNQCHRHKDYLQKYHPTFYNAPRHCKMDRISAAFVPVVDIPCENDVDML